MVIFWDKHLIHKNADFYEVYYKFQKTYPRNILLVIDDDGKLVGIIGVKEISSHNITKAIPTAYDIANKEFTFLYNQNDYRSKALELFYEHNYCNIPIVTSEGKLYDLVNRIDFYELRMTSYMLGSDEDIILAFVLRDTKDLFYIDVGAFDPDFASVTKFFYDKGARGINIEPQLNQYQMLLKARPRDININALCSDSDGEEMCFYACYGGGSSTAVPEYAYDDAVAYKIKSVSLKNVIDSYLDVTQNIHFLKIDVEGFEKQVILGIDFSHNRPWILIIESTVPSTDIPTYHLWEDILIDNEYVFAGQYGINRFYVDKSMSDKLLPRFIDIDTIKRRLLITSINQNSALSYV